MPKTLRITRLATLLALVLLGAVGAGSISARVVKVYDGDSFDAIYDNKLKVEVRLFGVDAPEKGQPYYIVAREFVSQLIYQKTVTIVPRQFDANGAPVTDHYGRILAVVMLPDGRCLNDELVKAGMAWWYQHYAPEEKKLAAFEGAARAAKLGLWSMQSPAPIPPWDWRHKNETVSGDDGGGFCASRNSKVFHLCSCQTVTTINPENVVRFKTEEEAKKSGRHRCKCRK